MRIECEVCSATYTIDDAQLSDQPIGAQCPYCGHVRLVRRGDQGSARLPPAPPFSSTAQSLGFGAPPPVERSPAAPPAFPGLTGGMSPSFPAPAAPPPFGAPFPPAARPPADPGLSGLGKGPPPPPPPKRGGGFAADLSLPAGAPPGTDRFGVEGFTTNALGSDTVADVQAARCQVCGTPLADEFDKVIGLCDVHQRERRGDGETPGITGGGQWWVKSREGVVNGPMSLDELRSRIRQGDFARDEEFSKDNVSYAPLARHQEIAYLALLGPAGDPGLLAKPRATVARRGGSSSSSAFTYGLLLAVVAGLGFLAWVERDQLAGLAGRFGASGRTRGPSTPNPLSRNLAAWKSKHPDVSGTAMEHLVTARSRHLGDTWADYQLAEDAFERALLLDNDEPQAIAGYVENLAIWRYPLASNDEVRTAKAALDYALELAPEHPAVHRALAAFALVRGELNACRAGADKALEKDATDGLAKLLLSGCYMEGNVQLAISEAERAAKLLPEMRRADRVLAQAYAKAGRFFSAQRLLDARLKVDPKNGAVHMLYGAVAAELSDYGLAEQQLRQAIEAGGDTVEAALALGEVLLLSGNTSGAAAEFKRVVDARPAPERAGRALAGWARAEVARGRAQEAFRLARQALGYLPKDPEALLVHGEAALLVGSATTAALSAKRALDVRSGEPAALVLAGRAAAAERARDRAIKSFEAAITNDPADPRLKGILAAMYLSVGGSQQAFALMRKAAEVDPEERRSRTRSGPLAVSEGPVREAIESFRRSASEEANASVASSSMGLLYYQLGDRTRATEAIARALRVDDANVTALLYDAQLALDRGDPKRAEAAAQRILAIERGAALGHLMLARALARRGEERGAAESYGAALRSNPGLLVAKVELAGLRLKSGERDKALSELASAFQVNPSSYVTRRLLLEAEF